jgi:hypothetical protein
MGNAKTFALMAFVYALTTTVKDNVLSRTREGLSFNYAMGAMGIIGYTIIDGASQIRAGSAYCGAQHDGRRWYSNPNFVYHSIKAVSGTALFYILFGAADNIAATLVRRFPFIEHIASFLPAQR